MKRDIIRSYLAGCEELPSDTKELKALIEKVSAEIGFVFTVAEIREMATKLAPLTASKNKEG